MGHQRELERQYFGSAVTAIAAFANHASARALKLDIRKLFKRNILDSLSWAIAALSGAPFAALREQFAEYCSGGSCSLIGDGKTAPYQAAPFNFGLVRYVDVSTPAATLRTGGAE